MILKDLQQILVEGQVASFLLPKRPPDGPLTVGIDGGYVRGQHKQGAFAGFFKSREVFSVQRNALSFLPCP
jgi:hypothetical protein